MKEEKYEITLLKGNVPNKHNVIFTSEALANAVENYSELQIAKNQSVSFQLSPSGLLFLRLRYSTRLK